MTVWAALGRSSLFIFIQQDSERAEAESGTAQTTMDIYVIPVEGAGPEDEMYAHVGVVLEAVELLQNLQSFTFASVKLYRLIYALNLSPKTSRVHVKFFRKSWWNWTPTNFHQKYKHWKWKCSSDCEQLSWCTIYPWRNMFMWLNHYNFSTCWSEVCLCEIFHLCSW